MDIDTGNAKKLSAILDSSKSSILEAYDSKWNDSVHESFYEGLKSLFATYAELHECVNQFMEINNNTVSEGGYGVGNEG